MRLAHHLLRHASGVFHFRLVVPRDLQGLFGVRIIKRSLRTRDPSVARLGAYTLSAHYAQIFANIRRKGAAMAKDGSEGHDKPRKPVVVLRTGMGNEPVDYACKINADGSASIEANGPEDHARAMEALAEMAKTMPAFRQREIPKVNPEPEEGIRSVLEALGASLQRSFSVQAALPAPSRPRAIGKSADAWLKSIEADTLRKTLIIKAAAINGFARHVGISKMLHEVQREDVSAWVEALRTSGLQTPTLINKTSYLRGFFNWAVSAGAYPKFPKDENPAAGHVIYRKQEKKKRRAFGFKSFTLEQVQALYAPDALANLSEGARWGAVIGLYTGARVSEVGQLALVDFTTVDSVPCMTITDEGEGQSVKNEPSLRTIPIHPDLITLGLMERVERLRKQGEKRLFPKIKVGSVNGQGDWLSKAYGRHIEAVGITKPDKGKYGFHSLRKTAIQAMKSAKVPLEWRCAYVGHDLDEEHVEIYSGEYGPKEMLGFVKDGLNWSLRLEKIKKVL